MGRKFTCQEECSNDTSSCESHGQGLPGRRRRRVKHDGRAGPPFNRAAPRPAPRPAPAQACLVSSRHVCPWSSPSWSPGLLVSRQTAEQLPAGNKSTGQANARLSPIVNILYRGFHLDTFSGFAPRKMGSCMEYIFVNPRTKCT